MPCIAPAAIAGIIAAGAKLIEMMSQRGQGGGAQAAPQPLAQPVPPAPVAPQPLAGQPLQQTPPGQSPGLDPTQQDLLAQLLGGRDGRQL